MKRKARLNLNHVTCHSGTQTSLLRANNTEELAAGRRHCVKVQDCANTKTHGTFSVCGLSHLKRGYSLPHAQKRVLQKILHDQKTSNRLSRKQVKLRPGHLSAKNFSPVFQDRDVLPGTLARRWPLSDRKGKRSTAADFHKTYAQGTYGLQP